MVIHCFLPLFLAFMAAFVYGMTRHIHCEDFQVTAYVIGVRIQGMVTILVAFYLAIWSY